MEEQASYKYLVPSGTDGGHPNYDCSLLVPHPFTISFSCRRPSTGSMRGLCYSWLLESFSSSHVSSEAVAAVSHSHQARSHSLS